MKITHVKTRALSTPSDNHLITDMQQDGSFGDAAVPESTGTREFVTVEMIAPTTASMASASPSSARPLTNALRDAVDALGELVIGEDPMRVEAIAAKLRRAASGAGPGGIFTLALSALDIALWDIKGKALGQPVSKLIGGLTRPRADLRLAAPCCASTPRLPGQGGPAPGRDGLQADEDPDGLRADDRRVVERMRVLREAIGPDIDLMCDINQLWNANQAIDVGTRVEPLHLFWLEDVVACRRLPGPGEGRRRPDDADRGRRVRLRHHALPPATRAPLDRHRHDRPGARRRRDAVHEGRGDGGGVQPAGRKPPDPRVPVST